MYRHRLPAEQRQYAPLTDVRLANGIAGKAVVYS